MLTLMEANMPCKLAFLVIAFLMSVHSPVCLAAPPAILDMVPPNNSVDVPPDIGELVIVFDRNMKMNSWSVMKHPRYPFPPSESNDTPWTDPRTFVLRLAPLEPGTTYGFMLNSPNRSGFSSADDQSPLPVTEVVFTTAKGDAGSAAPTRGRLQSETPASQPQARRGGVRARPGPKTDQPPVVTPENESADSVVVPLIMHKTWEPRERAFSILVPDGWQFQGGIFRVDPATAGGPGNSIAAKADFTLMKDQGGTVMLHYFPDWSFADGPAARIFEPGGNYQGMMVRPLVSAVALLQDAFQQTRPQAQNVRLVDQKQLTDTIQAYRQALAPLNQNLQMVGLPPIGVDAGRILVEYDEGGVHYLEEMATAVIDMRGSAASWNNSRAYAFRAPADQFEYWRNVAAIAHNSIKINMKWLAGELRGQNERAQQVIKVMHEIQRIENEIVANRQKTNHDIMYDNYLTLTGQEDYVNPYTNDVERDTGDYQYRWVNPDGDRVYSNDSEFDPNRVTNRGDYKLTRVKQQ